MRASRGEIFYPGNGELFQYARDNNNLDFNMIYFDDTARDVMNGQLLSAKGKIETDYKVLVYSMPLDEFVGYQHVHRPDSTGGDTIDSGGGKKDDPSAFVIILVILILLGICVGTAYICMKRRAGYVELADDKNNEEKWALQSTVAKLMTKQDEKRAESDIVDPEEFEKSTD